MDLSQMSTLLSQSLWLQNKRLELSKRYPFEAIVPYIHDGLINKGND
jgi:hypothetical protein